MSAISRAGKPIEIDGNMLRALFAKRAPRSDTRPFFARLLASIKPVLRGNCRKGVTFTGIRGGAEF